jgi:hypothetical protein
MGEEEELTIKNMFNLSFLDHYFLLINVWSLNDYQMAKTRLLSAFWCVL